MCDDLVIVGFKVFKEKIKKGIKCRTLRRVSERYMRMFPGTTLHLYWKPRTKEMELLHKVQLAHYYFTTFENITEQEAWRDGFGSLEEMHAFLRETYKKEAETQEYMWLTWDPPCAECGTRMILNLDENPEGYEIHQCPECSNVRIYEPASGETSVIVDQVIGLD